MKRESDESLKLREAILSIRYSSTPLEVFTTNDACPNKNVNVSRNEKIYNFNNYSYFV